MRTVVLMLVVLGSGLGACAPAARPRARYDVAPAAHDWGPHPGAPIEWWYLSGVATTAAEPRTPTLAFHAAFFRAPVPAQERLLGVAIARVLRGTYSLATLSVTDLETGERYRREAGDLPFTWACASGPPLCLGLGDVALRETGEGRYAFHGGPLALGLVARTPPIVHPPGWTGGGGLGALAYQSVPRLRFEGTWRGRPITGEGWLDHQWGDLLPGRDARWDWHGLHLDDGSSVMLYRLSRLDGTNVRLQGSRTRPDGSVQALEDLAMEPLSTWQGAGGRVYATSWRARAGGLDLAIAPLRPDQETPSLSGVIYWEGPVRVLGQVEGRRVEGLGMGEFLPWPLPAPAPRPPGPPAPPR